ncbi:MAG: lipoate--protein ligase family protein [Candidatus Hodarchaeales archaeon]|jgi:lipoate-protein ligase A
MIGRRFETNFLNVHYNLALEQAILYLHPQNKFSVTVRFWTNPKAVILGRSQQVEEEVDLLYCSKNNIKIGRRISGGGTVFHDSGNLNISIFFPRKLLSSKTQNVSSVSKLFSELMILCLKGETGENDFTLYKNISILFNDKKISGSAGYFRGSWFLHHMTLLLQTDLTHLNHVLRAGKKDYSSLRPSNFFPTLNLPSLSKTKLMDRLINLLNDKFSITLETGTISDSEKKLALQLTKEMYSQRSWIWHKKRKLIEKEFSSQ